MSVTDRRMDRRTDIVTVPALHKVVQPNVVHAAVSVWMLNNEIRVITDNSDLQVVIGAFAIHTLYDVVLKRYVV